MLSDILLMSALNKENEPIGESALKSLYESGVSYVGEKAKDFMTNIIETVAPVIGGPLVGLAVNLIQKLIGGEDP